MAILRLHPLVYWITGLLLLGLAVYIFMKESGENAARSEALEGSRPEAVAIEAFDPAIHSNEAREAVVLGEVGLDAAYQLTRPNGAPGAWVAPLRPAEGGGERTTISRGVLETDGAAIVDRLSEWAETDGADGPVVRLHGVWVRPAGRMREVIGEAFAEKGLTLAEDALFIDPFLTPREVALAQRTDSGWPGAIAVIGILVFLYGFIPRFFRRRR